VSVFKRANSETYSYDFVFRCRRFSGNTGKSTKREAEREEARLREELKAHAKTQAGPMAVGVAFAKYYLEVGQFHANADNTLRELEWMEKHLGKATALHAITIKTVNDLIAKRRGMGVKPATVNRTVTVRLRAVMNHARHMWKLSVSDIDWKKLMLKEPQERVRELWTDEETKLFAALRADYHPIVRMAMLSGCRREELLELKWRDIDFQTNNLTVTGKGDKDRIIPLTSKMRDILTSLRIGLGTVPSGSDPVFTYVVQRANKERGLKRGARMPITEEGLKSIYKRAILAAEIHDFTFHDLRHTRATRLLRESGNLRLVKELLGHSDIATTVKYAHVTNDDLRNALEAADRQKSTEKDRKASNDQSP